MRRRFSLRISGLLLQLLDLGGDVAAGLSVNVAAENETTEQRDGRNNSSCCHGFMSSVERQRLCTSRQRGISNLIAGSFLNPGLPSAT
jgi:hypothetical protein